MFCQDYSFARCTYVRVDESDFRYLQPYQSSNHAPIESAAIVTNSQHPDAKFAKSNTRIR